MAMGNDPVNNVDRDGGFAGPGPGFLGKLFGYNIATAANGVLGRVPGLLSGIGKFALPVLNTSISSSHMEVGGQLEDECPNCVLATYLRESMFLTYGSSSILNPFYKAEAIFGDLGGVLAGAESDVGKFFIISGPDKGKFIDYTEIAGGIAPEMGFGIELGRVDFTGDISAFSSSYLEGFRHKAWVGLSGEIIGVGAGFASSFIDGKGYVIGTSVQVGTGISTPITVGYNHGTVKLKKEEQ